MGFQSGINQTLGAVAGAAFAVKDSKEKEEAKQEAAAEKQAKATEQGLLAKEQYHEARADVTRMSGEVPATKEALDKANTAYDLAMAKRPGGKGNTKAAIAEGQKKALTEKEAAQRAFDELADRIEAKQAMMSRAEAIMKRTNTWGGMR